MKIQEWVDTYAKRHTPPEVLAAGLYLESIGLEFCSHFSTGNAIDKAAKAMCDELEGGDWWGWGYL